MGGTLTFILASALLLGQSEPPRADQEAADELLLKNAGLKSDGPALLDFFRRRTLAEDKRAEVRDIIKQLGANSYRVREHAMNDLIGRGPVVMELLREAVKNSDLEIARRAEKCMVRIQEKDVAIEVPAAAARLIGLRKPDATMETLLAYIPFADNESVADEVRQVLAKLAVVEGKVNPLLVKGLEDTLPLRRAASAEALAKAGEHKQAVRKLLQDPEPFVRLRVALALVHAREPEAVAVLIDVLPQLPITQAWQAEDVLYRLGEGKNPPTVSLGGDEAARKKCRDAWKAWWDKEGKGIDLAKLAETPRLLGYTLVVLLDENRVVELGADNQPRWQVDNLVFPLDAQVLPGDRVLVAEYHAQRITERNTKGEILWQKRIAGPLVAQRLNNGNTFLATDSQVMEVDRDDKEVFSFTMANGERIMKALKLLNGEIVCLTSDARIVRLDTTGKELHSFTVSLGTRLFGGRLHMLSNGRVLVPHNAENKVVEYDAAGKAIWEVAVDQPIAATRLPNGNTLVTTMIPNRGAVEFDRTGKEVWSYRTTTRVTRALRR